MQSDVFDHAGLMFDAQPNVFPGGGGVAPILQGQGNVQNSKMLFFSYCHIFRFNESICVHEPLEDNRLFTCYDVTYLCKKYLPNMHTLGLVGFITKCSKLLSPFLATHLYLYSYNKTHD